MTNTIAIVGSPTALGGHFGGMEQGPSELRQAGLIDRLRSRPGLAGATLTDDGDAPNEPGWAPDPDPVMKNRQLIIDYPRLRRNGFRCAVGCQLLMRALKQAASMVCAPSPNR